MYILNRLQFVKFILIYSFCTRLIFLCWILNNNCMMLTWLTNYEQTNGPSIHKRFPNKLYIFIRCRSFFFGLLLIKFMRVRLVEIFLFLLLFCSSIFMFAQVYALRGLYIFFSWLQTVNFICKSRTVKFQFDLISFSCCHTSLKLRLSLVIYFSLRFFFFRFLFSIKILSTYD